MKRATLYNKDVTKEFTGFNPRPREEGEFCQNMATQQAIGFNPRPREEGDRTLKKTGTVKDVSIHALVKRARVGMGLKKVNPSVSIHALVKRATISQVVSLSQKAFQSTPS